jgi:hypothetical protein
MNVHRLKNEQFNVFFLNETWLHKGPLLLSWTMIVVAFVVYW